MRLFFLNLLKYLNVGSSNSVSRCFSSMVFNFFFSPFGYKKSPQLRDFRHKTTQFGLSSSNCVRIINMGWEMGIEPTTFGTTIRRSNQLSYTHHNIKIIIAPIRDVIGAPYWTRTNGLLLRRQLLYPAELKAHMEQVMGIEPT